MHSLFDARQHVSNLLSEVREGRMSRRSFVKMLGWLGLSVPSAIGILESASEVWAGQKSSQSNQEIDRLLKELGDAVAEYNAKVDAMDDEEDNEILNDQGEENVYLRLTHPAGKSPKVFQSGWVFGAECLFKPQNEDDDPIDVSDEVEWSGTARFSPATGASSHPSFNSTGSNTIVLAISYKGAKITRTTQVDVVSTEGYAHVGSVAVCEADAHGCPACPHPVKGNVLQGSPQVLINGKPAARLGDPGQHAACCGPNTFTIAEGDPDVLINGKPAARSGCKTLHCGGIGQLA